MISSTVALQMNGLGFWFQACRNASMARFSSGTLTKLPRRIAFSVNSRNQRSTKFSQLELVGTKWHTKRQRSNALSLLPRRSEEHTSELQSHSDLVCRLLLEKKKTQYS